MATLSSGDTLSLADLRDSTAATVASISSVMGSTPSAGSNISFSSFAIDSVGSLSGFTYGVENTSETYTLSFGEAGTNHDAKLAQYASNFTWSVAAGSTITIGGSEHKSATITFSDRANSSGVLNSVASNTLRVVYDEPYNGHIGAGNGMNSNKDKTVYAVDSYDGNSSALCLTADSPIELADGEIIEAGDLDEGDILKGVSLNGLSDAPDGNFLRWESDTLGNETVDVKVVNITYSFASRYYDVNNGEITATAEHPMLVKDSINGIFRFKEIHRLEIGDKLIKEDGSEVEVLSVETVEKTVEIVSIDVDGPDTYITNGYVTHNKGANSFSDFSGPGAPTMSYATGPATISWTTPTSTGTQGITDYQWQLADDSGFATITSSGTTVTSDVDWATTSHNISGLATGTYYGRVRAREMGVYGAWSSTLTISHTFDT
jgi:hypothetical protein